MLSMTGLIESSSVYQDIPLYSLQDFEQLAPEEARTSSVLEDEHQLMLNRLSFELAERQRFVFISPVYLPLSSHVHLAGLISRGENSCRPKKSYSNSPRPTRIPWTM